MIKRFIIFAIALSSASCTYVYDAENLLGMDKKIYYDGRLLSSVKSDNKIYKDISAAIYKITNSNLDYVRVSVFNSRVLLFGSAHYKNLISDINDAAINIMKLNDIPENQLINKLTVKPSAATYLDIMADNMLNLKIRARLFKNKDIQKYNFKLIVNDRIAYIIGSLPANVDDALIYSINDVGGLKCVVDLLY